MVKKYLRKLFDNTNQILKSFSMMFSMNKLEENFMAFIDYKISTFQDTVGIHYQNQDQMESEKIIILDALFLQVVIFYLAFVHYTYVVFQRKHWNTSP